MADKLAGFVPECIKGTELREPIVRLAMEVTDRVPVLLGKEKITVESPEYWGLCAVCPTDEMAEVAIKMKKRKPRTFNDMLKLTGMEPDHLQELLDHMSYTGLIEYN